jgi:hypothetical protein
MEAECGREAAGVEVEVVEDETASLEAVDVGGPIPFIMGGRAWPGNADDVGCCGSIVDVRGSVVDEPDAVCALSERRASRMPGFCGWWNEKAK